MIINWAKSSYITIVVTLAAALVTAGCAHKAQPVEKPLKQTGTTKPAQAAEEPERPKVKATMNQVTLRWEEGNQPKLLAIASKARGNEITETGDLEHVTATLYKDGKKAAVLQAPRVDANRKDETLLATGGAVLKAVERNTTIRSPRVKWQAKTHKITGSGGVVVESENGSISADSFSADTELKNIEFNATDNGGEAVVGGKPVSTKASATAGK